MLGNFACFFVIFGFFLINFFKKSFWNTIRVPNSLEPDHAWHFVFAWFEKLQLYRAVNTEQDDQPGLLFYDKIPPETKNYPL